MGGAYGNKALAAY